MHIKAIAEARRFSPNQVQRNQLVDTADLHIELLCFEAGQRDQPQVGAGTLVYQVVEGEALLRHGGQQVRLGKGRLLTVDQGTEHTMENAGGGLLVVMATRSWA